MNISEKLKKLRKTTHITQKELTEKVGISKPSYFEYEQNPEKAKGMSLRTAKKIAEFFKAPFYELFEIEDYSLKEHALEIKKLTNTIKLLESRIADKDLIIELFKKTDTTHILKNKY